MDNRTALNTTTSFGQDNNQMLLNAVKSKFAAKTASEAETFSPPKFTIPMLKTHEVGDNSNVVTVIPSTNMQDNGQNQLNTFLLKELQNKQSSQAKTQSHPFEVPQLHFGKEESKCPLFEIPLLNSSQSAVSNCNSVSSLTTAINQLNMQNNTNPLMPYAVKHPAPSSAVAIDLTSALSSKSFAHPGTPSTRDLKTKQTHQISTDDFVIPFIDCDRLDNATSKQRNLVPENEYCLIDISQSNFKPSLKQPSAVGKLLFIVPKRYTPIPQKYITSDKNKPKLKHYVKPFAFDTKSPDDKVLETLSKYSRR